MHFLLFTNFIKLRMASDKTNWLLETAGQGSRASIRLLALKLCASETPETTEAKASVCKRIEPNQCPAKLNCIKLVKKEKTFRKSHSKCNNDKQAIQNTSFKKKERMKTRDPSFEATVETKSKKKRLHVLPTGNDEAETSQPVRLVKRVKTVDADKLLQHHTDSWRRGLKISEKAPFGKIPVDQEPLSATKPTSGCLECFGALKLHNDTSWVICKFCEKALCTRDTAHSDLLVLFHLFECHPAYNWLHAAKSSGIAPLLLDRYIATYESFSLKTTTPAPLQHTAVGASVPQGLQVADTPITLLGTLPCSSSSSSSSFPRKDILSFILSDYREQRPMTQELLTRGTEEQKLYWWVSIPPDYKYQVAKDLADIALNCRVFRELHQSLKAPFIQPFVENCMVTASPHLHSTAIGSMQEEVVVPVDSKSSIASTYETFEMFMDGLYQKLQARYVSRRFCYPNMFILWFIDSLQRDHRLQHICYRLYKSILLLVLEEEGMSDAVHRDTLAEDDAEWLAVRLLFYAEDQCISALPKTTKEEQMCVEVLLHMFGREWVAAYVDKTLLKVPCQLNEMKGNRSSHNTDTYDRDVPQQTLNGLSNPQHPYAAAGSHEEGQGWPLEMSSLEHGSKDTWFALHEEGMAHNTDKATSVVASKKDRTLQILRHVPTRSYKDRNFSQFIFIYLGGLYNHISTIHYSRLPNHKLRMQQQNHFGTSKVQDNQNGKDEWHTLGYTVREDGTLPDSLVKQISRNRRVVEEERKKHESDLTIIERLWPTIPKKVDFSLIKKTKAVYIGPSKVHGMGVFIDQHVKRGELVIEYVGEVLNEDIWDTRLDKREMRYEWEHGRCYVFSTMCQKFDQYIDATVSGNLSRFINHSCEPNCESLDIPDKFVDGEYKVGIFALRDLFPGEELFYRYEFSEKAAETCFCGTSSCEGVM